MEASLLDILICKIYKIVHTISQVYISAHSTLMKCCTISIIIKLQDKNPLSLNCAWLLILGPRKRHHPDPAFGSPAAAALPHLSVPVARKVLKSGTRDIPVL